MTKVKDLRRAWMKNPKFKTAYQALGKELELVRSIIEARTGAGLSQTQLARRMKTSQSYVARIETALVISSDWIVSSFCQCHPISRKEGRSATARCGTAATRQNRA
ncbi:MAG: helix-turn-helix transcriptional regulator [Vicinamibacterales bacterium]|jgi:ribosome-binding protein aMBF1 (putative translation factor)